MSSKRHFKRKFESEELEAASFEESHSKKKLKPKMSTLSDDDSSDESDEDSAPSFSSASFSSFKKFEPKSNSFEPPVGGYGKAEEMMKKHGYKAGEGLGKKGQGRLEPIALSTQQGRRGMGFKPVSQGKPYEGPGWDKDQESTIVHEIPEWCDNNSTDILDYDTLIEGIVMGPPKLTIDDETNFCNPKILDDILSLKTLFDNISKENLRTLVERCNLYETIKNAFFMNRAALKMANLDAAFDFMFTQPKDEDGAHMVTYTNIFYFADVCAGPGGFTEYILWKNKCLSKGFGFTLKGENDFKISNMFAAPTETFYPFYGVKDNGNVFDPENLNSLEDFVLQYTDNQGVHTLMADGGFSVEGEENIQEIKSKQLYLCQCICALKLVRENGSFVVKLFDCFTEFTIGLIYLMSKCFKRFSIHKPVTSRPANSERYLICKWKLADCKVVEDYLMKINSILWKNSSYNNSKPVNDILKLVPFEVMQKDVNFFNYIYDSNNKIGESQIISLLKINELYNNSALLDSLTYNGLSHEEMKAKLRKDCLAYWQIPDVSRKTAARPSPDELISKLMEEMVKKANYVSPKLLKDVMNHQPRIMTSNNDYTKEYNIESIYDWYFIFCNNMDHDKFNFYLGAGGSIVYKYDGRVWRKSECYNLPEGTLIFAEDVDEKRKQGPGTHSSHALHIIEAFTLGYTPVFHRCLKDRYQAIELFCKAMERPQLTEYDRGLIPLRCKTLYMALDLPVKIFNLAEKTLKNGRTALTTPVPGVDESLDKYFVVDSLMFFRHTKEPFLSLMSKTEDRIYYVDKTNKIKPSFKIAIDSFQQAFQSLMTSFKCQFKKNFDFSGGLDFLLKKCNE